MIFKPVVGERNSVQPEFIASCYKQPYRLNELEHIYKAEKFCPFYECLLSKTFHFKSNKCSGGKHNKMRLTGLETGNGDGHKLPLFVIGESKNPRGFVNVESMSC